MIRRSYQWPLIITMLASASLASPSPPSDRRTMREPGLWSLEATALSYWETVPLAEEWKNLTIPSPDRENALIVRAGKDENELPQVFVMKHGELLTGHVVLESHPEVAWSPDSRAFFVTYSDGGLVGSWHVLVYSVEGKTLTSIDVAKAVREDLVGRFPPCKTGGYKNLACSDQEIRAFRKDLDWVNVAAIKWLGGSNKLLLVSQVPCSSRYGFNMCRYMGYIVSVPSGKILSRYSKRSFHKQWGRYCGNWPP